jgi:hypothetical protein
VRRQTLFEICARDQSSANAEVTVKKVTVLIVALGALFAPLNAHAQWPVSFGIAAGPTFSSDAEDVGYHVGGLIAMEAMVLPIGFRVDGVMNQFSHPGGKTRIFDVTANMTYSMIPVPRAKPYVIGGLGFYGSRVVGSSDLGTNDVGINFGAGVKFSLVVINGFVDARYHHIFGENGGSGFIPVSIGLTF